MATKALKIVTDCLHGGYVFEAARILGCPWQRILDFSASINPIGPPKGLRKFLDEDFDRLLCYPEIRAKSLTLKLAELTGLSPDHFLPGAGSTPQLYLLPRVLEMTRPVIIGPAFSEYEAALIRNGLSPHYVLTSERDDWRLIPETIERVLQKKPDAVFLANPANPTGRLIPYDLLMRLVLECRRTGAWLIVDEAFIDFTEEGYSLLPLVGKEFRLVVLRSLTKIFALPGLRLAYLAAHPNLVARLAIETIPWSLSSPAISAGLFCLSKDNYKVVTLKGVKAFRRFLVRELAALELGHLFPSEANYILLRLASKFNSKKILDYLFLKGILLRDLSGFHGLRLGYLRLAVRPASETVALSGAITEFLTREKDN